MESPCSLSKRSYLNNLAMCLRVCLCTAANKSWGDFFSFSSLAVAGKIPPQMLQTPPDARL